jgi:hypothetical protein
MVFFPAAKLLVCAAGTSQRSFGMYHAATHQTLASLTGWNFMSTAFFHHAQNIY